MNDRRDLGITLDTPSFLLRELGIRRLLFMPGLSRCRSHFLAECRFVEVALADDFARRMAHPRVLYEGDTPDTWGLIRLVDPAGSKVACIGFHYDWSEKKYSCVLKIDIPGTPEDPPLRVIRISALCSVRHTLLPFQDIMELSCSP